MVRTYSELKKLKTFEERFEYLKLHGTVGEETFGFDRYLNQILYKSQRWLRARDEVIIRDMGCDLGIEGYDIQGQIIVHHMNPITLKDLQLNKLEVYSPEFLICTTLDTHNAIHYGDASLLPKLPITRKPGDTKLW